MRIEWWSWRHDPERLRELREEARALPNALRLSLEAFLLVQDGRMSDAVAIAKEAEAALPEPPDRRQAGPTLYTVGIALDETGQYDDARRYFAHAARAFDELGDKRSAADARSEIGLAWHRQSEFARALQLQQEYLDDCRRIGHRRGEANAWNRIANAQDRLGDYVAALESHQKSLRLRQALGDGRGEAASLGNIGNVHVQLSAYDDALRWYEASVARCRETGFVKQEIAVLGNMGLAFQGKGDWERARRCHEESLRLKRPLGDVQGEANTLGNLANVLMELGLRDEASRAVEEALTLNRRMGDRHSEAHNLLTIAKLAERARAIEAGSRAVELAREIGSKELLYLAHEALSGVHRAAGELECALDHYEAFHRIKEEVFTESMAIRTRSLRAQHEMEQARKETEIQRLRTEELAQALAEAERHARQDGLTSLLNRRVGLQRLDEAWSHSVRYNRPLSVLVVDVDHFKRINDRFLHATGDMVLKTLGATFRDAVRASDIVARLGGEEFLFVLPDTDGASAFAFAERLRESVAAHDWSSVAEGLAVTLSIGLCADTLCESAERLLSLADARLYEAKSTGRNRVVGKNSAVAEL